jgi:predicted nucleic acid-binding protein
MPEQAIVDTSVLIALERISTIDVLCKIYSQIMLPEAVVSEFGPPSIDCYSKEKVENPMVRLLVSDLNLGKGEAESIALASETGLRLLLDDLKARKVAEKLGLRITGTIGILLKAESMALIDNAHDKARELRNEGFYISDQILDDLSRSRK